MDEAVLRGNSAILKCHIPSFVADFIQVASWLEDEEREIFASNSMDLQSGIDFISIKKGFHNKRHPSLNSLSQKQISNNVFISFFLFSG